MMADCECFVRASVQKAKAVIAAPVSFTRPGRKRLGKHASVVGIAPGFWKTDWHAEYEEALADAHITGLSSEEPTPTLLGAPKISRSG